ncbi:MAG: thioredoxin domain-containing protein [Clostridiales bacterium]|jgi:uncharacterized protein YyaL (SSP411 family)|nr:thioredoxin domain-containing protein [Clostridiales bacterium]
MNRLQQESSPYLLQHAANPVDWYPWGIDAFTKARRENKPVFLSIGYSTCHWCHVMARESFEDAEVADVLNRHFVPVKVDKEERPDIDSVYMNACMTLTGSGGWPLTVIMDHSGRPFFAGTYFPKQSRYGRPGLLELLGVIYQQWQKDRQKLLASAEEITAQINQQIENNDSKVRLKPEEFPDLIQQAIAYYKAIFDRNYGGFGPAPKFPTPHNLLFLLEASENLHDPSCLEMAEKTLLSMAKGGIFDQIGFGFSRYSTDAKWLAPHFEKMLYDNALLIMAYTRAYEISKNPIYKTVAENTILWVKREMTDPEGGFYSAQDADSDGVEGKYYLFTPKEIISLLGEALGQAFCRLYDISQSGNFEGKNIPNQIIQTNFDNRMSPHLPKLYEYRKGRTRLHKDDKILTAWNALMIAALADAAVVFGNEEYLEMAQRAACFIEKNLCQDDRVFTGFREGKRTGSGFLDDYAFYIYALLRLYYVTLKENYLKRAQLFTQKVITDYFDPQKGGFYLAGRDGEALISQVKETYDGALPSGNSVMALNLIILNLLTGEYGEIMTDQLDFMTSQAADLPGGHSFFLYSMLEKDFAGRKITAVLAEPSQRAQIESLLRGKAWTMILDNETPEYRLKDSKTTYYVCEQNICNLPQSELPL